MYEQNPPNQDIYVVDFARYSGDLGVSLILRAECEVATGLQAWRRFPEYKRIGSRMRVSALDCAEVDWQTRRLVVKRKKRTAIPARRDKKPDQDFNNDWQIEDDVGASAVLRESCGAVFSVRQLTAFINLSNTYPEHKEYVQ